MIDTSRISQNYVIKNLTREAKLLSMLNHPNIVKLYETIQCGPVYYLVTELATGGDLCSHVQNQPSGRLDENSAKSYTKQLAAALRYMHSKDIIHRDLKMENIMLHGDKKSWVKIVDFGLSNIQDHVNPLKTQCGSPEYAAPELFVIGKKYGPEIDLWSLGVILYVMGSGRLPFISPRDNQISSDERRRRLMTQINRGLTALEECIIDGLSSEYKNLLKRLLTPDARKRITVKELCCHPWIIGRQKPITTISIIEMTLEAAQEGVLDNVNNNMVVDKLMNFTDQNRRTIELNIIKKRFGKTGGMYNILAHKMQRNIIKHAFKIRCSTTFRTLKPNQNISYLNSNEYRNKAIRTSSKINLRIGNQILNKSKLKDSITVSKCDRYTENVF